MRRKRKRRAASKTNAPIASSARPTPTKKTRNPDAPPPGLRQLRDEAAALFRAAVAATDPTRLVAAHLAHADNQVVIELGGTHPVRWPLPLTVAGAGKGAARMAAGCERVLGAAHVRGEVIVADGCGVPLESVTVTTAGHPLPDARGEAGALRLLELIRRTRTGGVLCLVSGGASSLLVCPAPPVTLRDKIRTTQLLLECGADIHELNTVRKHLSLVKGGGLLRAARVSMVGLLISDVVGDDPGTIGSGPTAPDATTFAEAWVVLERFQLLDRVPTTVAERLRQGMDGKVAETVKAGSADSPRCRNLIIGSNRTAVEGAAAYARAHGWTVVIEPVPLIGDTTVAARAFGCRLRDIAQRQPHGRLCVLAGGETTVVVKGSGRGGRNQEFALALVDALAEQDIVVLSAGTDGIDGPTDAAGAFVDGATQALARQHRLRPEAALAGNDAYTFFSKLGDLFQCGPTGTNVMDIKIALLAPRHTN